MQLAVAHHHLFRDHPRRGQQGAIVGQVGRGAADLVGDHGVDDPQQQQRQQQPAHELAEQAAAVEQLLKAHRAVPAGSPARAGW
ncbi:hypothetical protein D3C85_1776500 [compost metagenome]